MERLSLLFIFFCLYIAGCSVPTTAAYRQLYSFTREEKKIKGTLGKSKAVSIKDFRENQAYEEDVTSLKEEVEKYILAYPDLSEQEKSNLRELKVMPGMTKDEAILLLDKPDKILMRGSAANYGASDIWIYRINKIRAFTVFILPVFFVREGYYLHFKDGILVGIERHYLKQIVQQGSAPGVLPSKEKTSNP